METAFLIDVTSIQNYVFGSNKLKDNIGASYIIENIFNFFRLHQECKIGYIGGGNALIFTESVLIAKKLIKEYTILLIKQFPGVSISIALKEKFENENYKLEIQNLFKILADNKRTFIPINTISGHGFTALCSYTAMPAVIVDNGSLISSITASKRMFKEDIEIRDSELLNEAKLNGYSFATEFEQLGQLKNEDSHIAIVHIDGNGFGRFFKNLDLNDTNKLSEFIKISIRKALIDTIVSYSYIKDSIKKYLNQWNIDNNVLPIRPIILGGDDVTFVCHGKLGIWFAEQFMNSFNKNKFLSSSNSEIQFSSCAGIAVVRSKYPFYRAYILAEELCKSAKSKNLINNGNWIDFQLVYSDIGNSLQEMRYNNYRNAEGEMLLKRPYEITGMNDEISFKKLCIDTLGMQRNIANSKIKELREKLTLSKADLSNLLEQIRFRSTDDASYQISNDSPLFDMIELLEIYPENLLNRN